MRVSVGGLGENLTGTSISIGGVDLLEQPVRISHRQDLIDLFGFDRFFLGILPSCLICWDLSASNSGL